MVGLLLWLIFSGYLAPCGMIADALTKVVMLTGESAAALLARYGASALFVSADGDLRATRDWSDGVHAGLARAFQAR